MKIITTSDGKEVQVSDEDYDYLKQFNWSVSNEGYVRRTLDGKHSHMHRELGLLMGLSFVLIDHRDQDKLNNQRANLRAATRSTNGMNRGKPNGRATSIYKGVSWDRSRQKWEVKIQRSKISIFLGYFSDEKEAARAYNVAALRFHGEFAYLNEVE